MKKLNLQQIYKELSRRPGLPQAIGMDTAMRFIRLAASLRRHIIHAQKPSYNPDEPPPTLPLAVHEFLGGALDLCDAGFVQGCWEAFKDTIWGFDLEEHSSAADTSLFYKYGHQYNLSSHALYPPTTTCTNSLCPKDTELLRNPTKMGRKVILFMLEEGACATYHYKLTCPFCKTTFHNNYSVSKKTRTYYPGIPDAIEVGKHQFISRDVLNMFMNMILISWTSMSNCATIYNESLGRRERQPKEWDFSFELRTEHIWEGIAHLAILEQYSKENIILVIPHGSDQKDCLTKPIECCNKLFEAEGQPEWAHYCEKCIRFTKFDSEGNPTEMVRAIISDGITIGHPCCGVAHCTVPLENVKRDRFCPGHQYRLSICAVEDCESSCSLGYLTCDNTSSWQCDVSTNVYWHL